jgi:tetratricopeptide (TPR) repeat protein
MANELSVNFDSALALGGLTYAQFMEKQTRNTIEGFAAIQERSDERQARVATLVGAEISRHIDESTGRIQASMDSGFSQVSNQLGELNMTFMFGVAALQNAIDKMSGDICNRLDALNDVMSNPLLIQSRELYRMAETDAAKGLFEEALEYLEGAIGKYKTDYRSWFLKGLIYSKGVSKFTNVINLDQTITALTYAAKCIDSDTEKSDDARRMAAEIWFYLGDAKKNKAYDLLCAGDKAGYKSMLAEARTAFETSFSFSDKMLEAEYNIARCNALIGDTAGAAQRLEHLIPADKNYCIKVINDSDFDEIAEPVKSVIEKLRDAVYIPARAEYDKMALRRI